MEKKKKSMVRGGYEGERGENVEDELPGCIWYLLVLLSLAAYGGLVAYGICRLVAYGSLVAYGNEMRNILSLCFCRHTTACTHDTCPNQAGSGAGKA